MRLKNVPGSREAIEASKYVIKEDAAPKGKWSEIFGNSNPVRIEIGMGKGSFIIEQARQNPDINFVGIEKFSSVLIRAVEKQNVEELPNLFFLRIDAEYINDWFGEGEAERIFLNFSDPWPKERHAKRRLTSRQFLKRYDKILKADGIIEFKTDNEALFDFTLEEVPEAGWRIAAQTRNLHESEMNEGNIMTEYESKFSALGRKICKCIIVRNEKMCDCRRCRHKKL